MQVVFTHQDFPARVVIQLSVVPVEEILTISNCQKGGAYQNKLAMHTQKLNLGLLLDSFNIPAWEYSAIQRIVNEAAGEFKLVILNEATGKTDQTQKNVGVYSIFNRMDEKIFTRQPDPFAPRNLAELLSAVPIIKVHPVQDGKGSRLGEAEIEIIREHPLDILIKFGFENLQLESLNVSKYGTWFYYHGDDRIMRGGPPGFWEVVENWPETCSALLSVGGMFSHSRVLFRSYFITYPLSPARHRSYYFWSTTSFLVRQIALLQQLGAEKYCQETGKFNTIPLGEIKKYEVPSNSLAIKSIAKIIIRLMEEVFQRIFYVNQWFLLFSLKKDTSNNFGEFTKLMPAKEKFWADPHVVRLDGKYYVFIEEFLNAKNKGHISVIELDEFGNWSAPVKILEKDYHLSYPFVFEWDDKFYMVPESHENKSIDLYECVEFPYKWNFKQCLMQNVSAVDTTLVHYSDKWWLFTAMAENEAVTPNVELFLFYTDDLFRGKWRAHQQNPIISDMKSARPAGSLFIQAGKLFRPSQDCSKAYGYGFDLNEIEVLTETEYRERKVCSVRPDWDKNILATHTFANCGNLTVIDAFRQTLKIG
jgi:hypothetical protein